MASQKNKLPIGFHTKILSRFMSEKDLETLLEDYKSNCYKRIRTRDITPLDRKIFKDYRENKLIFSELSEKYGKSRNFVMYAIALVAKEN